MGMFQADGFRRWIERRDPRHESSEHADAPSLPNRLYSAQTQVWVVHASETGVAEDLAHEARRQLTSMGQSSRLVALDAMDVRSLARVDHALFLASTSGDGEPPCMADAFHRHYMQHPAALSGLRYGLLALGDRRYDNFCAFGRQLDAWLRTSGAQPLFEAVEMDDEDAPSMRQWTANVRTLGAPADVAAGAKA